MPTIAPNEESTEEKPTTSKIQYRQKLKKEWQSELGSYKK